MIVTIHQPEAFPWLGFFSKMKAADAIVLYDTCDFEKNYFQNRNKISKGNETQWLTIPVEKHNHKPIKNILLGNDVKWRIKVLNRLEEEYKSAPYYKETKAFFNEFFYTTCSQYLVDYTIPIIKHMAGHFMNSFELCTASSLPLSKSFVNATDKLVDICKVMGADTYLSGPSGRDYLELEKFKQAGIEVRFHEFIHPVYDRGGRPWISHLSAIDALMWSSDSKELI